jgi:hypothetical protein
VKNINIRNYKIWIIIFGFSNIFLLLWSIELLPITKKFISEENEIIIITPKHKFVKIAPPKDKQFPNDKSDIWDVYNEDDKKLKKNTEKDDKYNKVLENNNVNKLKSSDTSFKELQESKTNKDKNSKDDNLFYSKKIINNKLEKIEDKTNKKKDKAKNSVNNEIIILEETNKSNNKANIKKIVKTKSYYVQTASLSKKEQVAIEWDRIQKKYKLNVEGLIFITQKTKLKNNQIFYRLLVGRFKSNDDAKSFCKKLNFNKSCIIKIIE